jgi:hypothetical protein
MDLTFLIWRAAAWKADTRRLSSLGRDSRSRQAGAAPGPLAIPFTTSRSLAAAIPPGNRLASAEWGAVVQFAMPTTPPAGSLWAKNPRVVRD